MDRRGYRPDPPSDVEGLALAIDDDPDDACIAREASDRLRVDNGPVDLSEATLVTRQRRVWDGDGDVGTLATADGGVVVVIEPEPANVDEGVGVALRR